MPRTNWAALLRTEIARRAREWAHQEQVPSYESRGSAPTVLFEPFDGGNRHGNLCDASYQAIRLHPGWRQRLAAAHPQQDALPPDKRAAARELDSSNSSDALLMNLFCYPGALSTSVRELFGCGNGADPEFGVRGKVPIAQGGCDRTELDMRLGRVIIEGKLTELDFTSAPESGLNTYLDFQTVFDTLRLPRDGDRYASYQLIRNVLAAHHHGYSFNLLCDARRPDLLRAWWAVHGAIRPAELRCRCGFVLWQEVARAAEPEDLTTFLSRKYALC